jgi:hypothetical protein
MAAFQAGDNFTSAEIFNSAIPQPVTEDFPVAAHFAFQAFSVVGTKADGTLGMATLAFSAAIAALGELVFSGVGTADETITIGAVTYTLKANVSTTANQVKIGASAAETAANLIAAVNGAAGSGTVYWSATSVHPTVSALSRADGVVGLKARTAGNAGNSIATTETGAATAFSTATLRGGADQFGVQAIGITTAPVLDTDVVQSVAIYRAGNFNPAALNWDTSFDTAAKKAAAFRDAPTPTNILIRERL